MSGFLKEDYKAGHSKLIGEVRLWDLKTQKLKWMQPHGERVQSVAFSPNGKIIASAGESRDVKLWDVGTGKLLKSLGHSDYVSAIAFAPDGQTLASAAWSETRLWNVGTGTLRRTLKHSDAHVESLSFSADGRFLACGGEKVLLWDWKNGKLQRNLRPGYGANTAVFSQNGKWLATAASYTGEVDVYGELILWKVPHGKEKQWRKRTLEHDTKRSVEDAAFAPNGKYFASAESGAVKLRELDSCRIKRRWKLQTPQDVALSIAFSPDSNFLAVGATGGGIKLWNVKTGALNQTILSVKK